MGIHALSHVPAERLPAIQGRDCRATTGDEAGIKSATFTVEGKFAFGLRARQGCSWCGYPIRRFSEKTHVICSVFVYPEVNDDIEIEVKESDVGDTYRASGAGGQHVNKTDSAVQLTLTGLVVRCQNQRSQHKTGPLPSKFYKSRLYAMELEAREKSMEAEYTEEKSFWEPDPKLRSPPLPHVKRP